MAVRHYFPTHILQNIYATLISPYLNYGILAWGNASKFLLDTLFLLQKRAIRIINHSSYLSHTNDLFKKSRILKITDLFYFNIGIFMFQFTTGNLPDAFLHMFTRNNSIHNYPTRQHDAFHLPRTRTIFAKKTIMFTGPKYWNELPMKYPYKCITISSFKPKLKHYLLSEYNSQNE